MFQCDYNLYKVQSKQCYIARYEKVGNSILLYFAEYQGVIIALGYLIMIRGVSGCLKKSWNSTLAGKKRGKQPKNTTKWTENSRKGTFWGI